MYETFTRAFLDITSSHAQGVHCKTIPVITSLVFSLCYVKRDLTLHTHLLVIIISSFVFYSKCIIATEAS